MNRPAGGMGGVASAHPWWRSAALAFVPGPTTPLLDGFVHNLLRHFRGLGHCVQEVPDAGTDALLTTAPFGEVLSWRRSLLFSARRRFRLSRVPRVFTLMHVRPARLDSVLAQLEGAVAKARPDPRDYAFPGLAPGAHRVLREQGRRGGPILALVRLLQAQAKSTRIILVVGDEHPLAAYHFDLVGAHPCTPADDEEAFYRDAVLRVVTALSTREVTQHEVVGEPIARSAWKALASPRAMCTAGRQLGQRDFFTEMVRIADLAHVPAVGDAVARQYSEGCFATWDPDLGALVATATGSARPVDKGNFREDEVAVIVGVRPDGRGALVRSVEGRADVPPSSEAVEMVMMDQALPTIALDPAGGVGGRVPVARSKLHGHRGVAAYDPRRVEYAPLPAAYQHYPVSCATEAQARGVTRALAGSEALQRPDDPRQVVFTVLPGHGIILVEKWVAGKAPFQVIWEHMDAGALEVETRVPQGPLRYVLRPDGRMGLEVAGSPALPLLARPVGRG
jgi:hypothetical protein